MVKPDLSRSEAQKLLLADKKLNWMHHTVRIADFQAFIRDGTTFGIGVNSEGQLHSGEKLLQVPLAQHPSRRAQSASKSPTVMFS